MSRSYKKNPILTDGHCRTTKQTKQIANRCVRRRNKRITSGYLMREPRYRDILTLDGMSYKRFFCSYDIHDYVSCWSKVEALHEYHHQRWHYLVHSDGTGEWWAVWSDYTEKQFLNYWAKCYRRK